MSKSPLLISTIVLILIGILFISISSLSEASNTIGDKFFFLRKQIMWLGIGVILFYISSKIKIEIVKKYASFLYLATLLALFLVLFPQLGNQALGARRWLNLGLFSIQPSELLKLTSIIFFAFLFSKEEKRNIKHLILYLSAPFLLIILEPNLSTAILISAIIISIYYLSGGEILSLFGLCSSVVVLSFILIVASPYRFARLKTLVNPDNNKVTSSYHSNQIILAISSGGLFGKGFANSDQKYKFLPKISTDSILAVIGEEVGFVGIIVILFIYLSLIAYLFKLSNTLTDSFESLIVVGVACWIAYQSLINISAIAAIIPLTGVPLPFISYGGSSLSTLMIAIGLVRNIEKRNSLLVYSKSDTRKTINKDHNHHRRSSYSSR